MFFIQDAYAQAAPQAQPGAGNMQIIMLVVMFAVVWFLFIRPQQKRAKEMQALITSLKKGDEVMTNGGIMGRIMDLDNFAIDLEIAKNTIIRVQRGVVVQILPKGSLRGALGKNKAANDDKADKTAKTDKAEDDSSDNA
mgnify:FL=1